jgi:hypothetical protein
MTLIDDAKTVLLKAWSIRLALLGAVFSAAEVALPFFQPLNIFPPTTMAVLALLASSGAALARLIAQPKMAEAKSVQQ